MYLSLLRLNPLSRHVSRDIHDVSELHRTIMSVFPEVDKGENPRAVHRVLHRLELDPRNGEARLYVQSKTKPDWLVLPRDYTIGDDAEQFAIKPVGDIYSKIVEGRRLRFRLRANPTRKIDTKTRSDGIRRHGRRVPVRGEQEQIAWLIRQGGRHGFEVNQLRIAAFGSAELKRSRKQRRTFQGVLYEGHLTVVEYQAFQKALFNGIGPAKAFGFGMMSVSSE